MKLTAANGVFPTKFDTNFLCKAVYSINNIVKFIEHVFLPFIPTNYSTKSYLSQEREYSTIGICQ